MAAPRVFLLDGLALAYRSHFTFIRRPMINSKGEHTSAIFGVAGTLIKLRDEHKPEYWALTWDSDQPTFRHREYAEYKATRSPMPEELVSQLPHLKELAAAIGLSLLEVPGFEADDIMATLAKRAVNDGLEAILVTPDKDLQQLIRPGVRVLSPRGREEEGEWVGEAEVEERWGVRPDQLGDVLALMGDSSDNIPGVPGVGQKTAARLISQFGNLDALYERIDEVKQPALHKRLTANREGAYFCRYLVTVREDVELPVSWENLVTRPADPVALQELGERFELRRLTRWAAEAREHRRAAPSLPVPPVAVEPAPVAQRRGEAVQGALSFGDEVPLEVDAFGPPVRIIDTPAALTRLAEELVQSGRGFCLDTETTSEEPMRAALVGIGVTIGERPAYVPIRHREGKNLPIEKVREILGPVLADPATVKVGQHLKYDSLVLLREGFPVAGLGFDTLIASYLLEPEGAHGLDHLSRLHLGVEKIPTRALLGGRRGSRTMDELPIDVVGAYCGEDVHCTWLLRDLFEPELASRQQENLFHEVEMELVQVLVDMEREGVYVDTGFLAVMSEELGRELTRLEASIHSAAGGPFNINSGPQLSEILFKKLGLPAQRQTKTGFSTSADVLEELAPLHALPRLILQFRQSAKLKSTYVDAIPALILPDTGRVHTEFHQTVAATGRLSSSNPGLQNIPTRTPLGREVRKAFRSRPGWHLLGADYSQIELRIMAHLSGDPALTEAFARGDDVHASTARRIFSLGDGDPSPEQRAQAKTVNFGVMYGMGARALSLQLGMPIGQASAFIHDYFKVHNGVADYLKALLEEARGTGYVHTVLGRRRYLPLLTASSPRARANAERAAINTPLQGSAADLIKVAMVRIHRQIQERGMESRLILQVHDELLFEFPPGEREELEEMVRREMTHAITLDIPLEVTIGVGERWFDVH